MLLPFFQSLATPASAGVVENEKAARIAPDGLFHVAC